MNIFRIRFIFKSSLFLIFFYTLILLLLLFIQRVNFFLSGNNEYEDLLTEYVDIFEIQESGNHISDGPEPPKVDITSLKVISPDFVSWIYVNENISYPVVRGKDNSYYLKHTFDNDYSPNGCIFLNSSNNSDFYDQHSIIYGHNMKNGSMFAGLHNYKDESFFSKNTCFWIIKEDCSILYKIFNVAEVKDNTRAYTFAFTDNFSLSDYLDYMKSQSIINIPVESYSSSDRIVTLSTCTAGGRDNRLVVQGIAIKEIHN